MSSSLLEQPMVLPIFLGHKQKRPSSGYVKSHSDPVDQLQMQLKLIAEVNQLPPMIHSRAQKLPETRTLKNVDFDKITEPLINVPQEMKVKYVTNLKDQSEMPKPASPTESER